LLWLPAVLTATVSNLDNLAVGTAYGMRGTRIAARSNLFIAVVTMGATAGAMTFGHALSGLLSSSVASTLGALIIIAIGAGTVFASLFELLARVDPGLPGDACVSHRVGTKDAISNRQALALGIALSLNNVGAGVGAGVAGVPPLATSLLAGALSLICVGGGSALGGALGRLVLGPRAPLIAGLGLLTVGTMMLPALR